MITATKPDEEVATMSDLAAMDFEPLQLDNLMSNREFLERSKTVYVIVRTAMKLLTMRPVEMADVVFRAHPNDPIGALEEMAEAREWLQGVATVLEMTEARLLVAFCKRSMQQDPPAPPKAGR